MMTTPADGVDDQPFCGAEIKISTPVACISTHAHPDAMQSRMNRAPTSWEALEIALRYSSGNITPAEVSTWGAKTTSGEVSYIVFVISSIAAGAKGDQPSFPVCRALIIVVFLVKLPLSKI